MTNTKISETLTIVSVGKEVFDRLIVFRHVVGLVDGLGLQESLLKLWLKRDESLRKRISDNLI